MKTLKIFKTIKLGKKPNLKDFKVSDWAKEMLTKIKYSKKGTLDLVVLSVEELGFKDNATLKKIYAKAKALGLELCPAEVGPQLIVQYKDQPSGEWLCIAMESISGSDGSLRIFRVEHYDDGRWLYSYYDDPVYLWFPVDQFVFVLPRKSGTKALEPSDSFLERLDALEKFKSRVEGMLKL